MNENKWTCEHTKSRSKSQAESYIATEASDCNIVDMFTGIKTFVPPRRNWPTYWRRVGAFVLDLLAIALVVAVVGVDRMRPYAFLLLLAYFVGFGAAFSRSPGKFITELEIVDLHGHKPGALRLTVRELVKVLTIWIPPLFLLPLIVGEGAALHDLVSGTRVKLRL